MIESPRPRSVATVGAKVWAGGGWSPLHQGGVVTSQRHPGHPVSSVSLPPALAGRRELVEQELAGGRRSTGYGSDQSGVGLGRRAARRRALRAGTPAWNRRAAAQAARPSERL